MIVHDDTRPWVNPTYDKSRPYEGNTPHISFPAADFWVGVVNDHLSSELVDHQAFDNIPLLCNNDSAVKIANNPVQHSRTKHIDIRHHFLRHHVGKGDIKISHIRTDDQLVDIFTKLLDESWFCKLRNELNIIDHSNVA